MTYEDTSKAPTEVLDAGATIVDAAAQLTREGRPRGKMVMEAIGVYDNYRQQLTRERDEARAEVERLRLSATCLRDAGVWVLNVASGVGKDGGPPPDGEYTDALSHLAQAVADAGLDT